MSMFARAAFKMKLLLTGFTVAVLLLLAPTATDASAGASPPPVAPHPRAGETLQRLPTADVGRDEQAVANHEVATAEEEEEAGRVLTPSWYKMLPNMKQLEQASIEPQQLKYIPGLKDSWNAVKGHVRRFQPDQLREAFDKVKSMTAASVDDAAKFKPVQFMRGFLQDPEARKEMLKMALAVLGMSAASMFMKNTYDVREVAATTLYITALLTLMRHGTELLVKLSQDAKEDESLNRMVEAVRQRLGQMFGYKNVDEAAEMADVDELADLAEQAEQQ